MSQRSLNQIEQDLAAKSKAIAPLAERFIAGGLDGDDLATFRRLKGEIETLHGEKRDAETTEAERKADLAAAQAALADHRHYNEPAGRRASGQVANGNGARQDGPHGRSIGERFVNSDQFRGYRDNGVGAGGRSQPFVIGSLYERHADEVESRYGAGPDQQRALVTSTTVTDLIVPQRMPGIYAPELRPLRMRDTFLNGRTDSNNVEFVTETGRTNNAAETAEATSLSDGAKPESGFALGVDNAPVRTIATLIYITRAALDDAALMRSYIDELLRRFIAEREDKQLLVGNGTAPNLRGINNASGILNLNGAYFTTTMPNKLDRIRRAKTRIRIAGRGAASTVVLHPDDLEAFELMKVDGATGQNQYVLPNGGPFGAGGITTIWRMQAVESEDQTAGVATVYDGRAAMVVDRMDAQVYVTDSNRDLFERNILTILCESRLAFPIFYPSRIAKVDLVATT